jgi:protein SCO1
MKPRIIAYAGQRLPLLIPFSLAIIAALSPALDNSRWGATYFPNVELVTQDGNVVHFYDDLLKGKIVAIDLIYTHCVDACPLETARLAQVQQILGERVGKDIFFYSITIDPKRDTPEILKEYAERYHAGPGWLFLTGKKDDIDLISRKLGLYSAPNPRNRDGHTPSLLLGNEATGQWMRNSALDNPRFLAITIGQWMDSWKNASRTAQPSYASAPQLNLNDRGKYIFTSHCAACHSLGKGDKIGPDLLRVTEGRTRGWLIEYIANPDKLLAAGDPVATELFEKYKRVVMPNLRLAPADIEEVINFLVRESEARGKAQEPLPAVPVHSAYAR